MTTHEIIQQLELLKAEIEWELSLEYQIVLDEAIGLLKHHDMMEDDGK